MRIADRLVLLAHLQVASLRVSMYNAYAVVIINMNQPSTGVCDSISRFTGLTNLTVESTGLADNDAAFDAMLKRLPNLKRFELRYKHSASTSVVPTGLANQSALTHLVLGRCIKPSLASWMYDLARLQSVEFHDVLRGSETLELSAATAQWTELQRLVLRRARLGSLPPEPGQLGETLTELDMSGNPQLESLPASFGRLRNVTVLCLGSMAHIVSNTSSAAVGSMSWIGLNMSQLRDLDISRCGLTQVCTGGDQMLDS